MSALRRDFPTGVEEPVIDRLDPADMPIISLSVTSPQLSPKDLTSLTEKVIRKRLENIEGVGSLKIVGGQRREIQVYLDPERMKAYNLTVPEVVLALEAGKYRSPCRERSTAERSRNWFGSKEKLRIPACFRT